MKQYIMRLFKLKEWGGFYGKKRPIRARIGEK